MAIAIPTVGSATFGLSASCVITKPTSLAVGDIMIAHMGFADAFTNATSVTPPSGWTQIYFKSNGNLQSYYAWKVADSSDAAATNFTFTSNASGSPLPLSQGYILRITGGRSATLIYASSSNTGTSSTASSTTITPTAPNSLILFLINEAGGSTLTGTSGYAMVTDNPSWTELYDNVNNNGSNYSAIVCGYALRTAVTATGTISATISASETWNAVAIAIEPPQNFTATDTFGLADSFPKMSLEIKVRDTLGLTDESSVEKSRSWTNTSKTSTTWTNTDKT